MSVISEQYDELDRAEGLSGSTPAYDPRTAKLCSAIQTLLRTGDDARQGWHANAWIHLCYYMGHQWVDYDRGLNRPRELPKARGEQRMTLNYTKVSVDAAVAKLSQHQPAWLVPPATDDERDVENARACGQLLDYLWHQLQCRSKVQELIKWAAVTGIGIMRVGFDSAAVDTLGGPDAPQLPDESVIDVEGPGFEVEIEAASQGNPSGPSGFPTLEVVPPFGVVFDPGAVRKDLSDARWVIERRWLHIDEIRERWPENGRYVKAAGTDGSGTGAASILMQDFLGTPTESSRAGMTMDRAEVWFFYEKPSRRFPGGRCVTATENVILEEHHELPAGRLPFVVVRYGSVPGRFYGQGIVEAVRPAQDMLNKQISARLQVVEYHSAPVWAVEVGSLTSTIGTRPGGKIEYNKGSTPPAPIPPPPISPQHEALENAAVQHIREISGINEISLGIVPGSISGRAAQWMAELDATKLSLVTSEIEEAMAVLGGMLLRLWRDYMPPETTISVLGKSSKLEAWAFENTAITSTSVRVLPGSMSVKHPSVKRETVVMLNAQGAYGDTVNDPKAQARLFRELEWGTPDWTEGEADSESKTQREENYLILTTTIEFDDAGGVVLPVKAEPWHDHAAHIQEIRMLLQSDELRNAEVERFEIARRHLAEHEGYASLIGQGWQWWTEYAPDIQALGAPPAAPAPAMPQAVEAPPLPGQEPPIDPATGLPMDPFGGPMTEAPMADLVGARGPGVSAFDTLTPMGS